MTKETDGNDEAKAKPKRGRPKKVEVKAEEVVEVAAEEASSGIKQLTGRPWFKWVAGGVLLLVVLFLIFSRGNEMIAKPFIEAQLKRVAENIKSQAALSGDEAILSHGDVSVDGGVFNKRAKIDNLKLEYTAQLPFGNTQRTVVSTQAAVVTADPISANAVNIAFPEPFLVERDGYQPLLFTFNDTPSYRYLSEDEMEEHSLDLPSQLAIRVNPDSDTPAEVTIAYAPGATFERSVNRTNAESYSRIGFRDIKLTSNIEENVLTLDGFAAQSKEAALDDSEGNGSRRFESMVNIAGFTLKQAEEVVGPYHVDADVAGHYAVLQATEDNGFDVDKVHMEIRKLKLSSADFSVSATGEFNREIDDPMLFGHADIDIKGLDKFRNSKLIGVRDEALKNALIARVTGNSDVNAPEAQFTIKREKQGTFYVGKTTFENLIGVIVTHALKQQNAQPVITPPKQNTPVPQPQ